MKKYESSSPMIEFTGLGGHKTLIRSSHIAAVLPFDDEKITLILTNGVHVYVNGPPSGVAEAVRNAELRRES